MNPKVVITDANIFIDLYELEIVNVFFSLELEVHTTLNVLNELSDPQRQILEAYISVKKLIVHNLQETDFIEIFQANYPKSLSQADKSVLHIAAQLRACVLSSDKVVRNYAKNKDIECHGMLWIFDRMIEIPGLTKREIATKLRKLVAINFTFRNSLKLNTEIEKRLKLWG